MIERDGEVSVKRQAELLDLSRSSVYYVARSLPERDLKLMRILDELHLKWPFYGDAATARTIAALSEFKSQHSEPIVMASIRFAVRCSAQFALTAKISVFPPESARGTRLHRRARGAHLSIVFGVVNRSAGGRLRCDSFTLSSRHAKNPGSFDRIQPGACFCMSGALNKTGSARAQQAPKFGAFPHALPSCASNCGDGHLFVSNLGRMKCAS